MLTDILDGLILIAVLAVVLILWRVVGGLLFNRSHNAVAHGYAFFALLCWLFVGFFLLNRILLPTTGFCISFRSDRSCEIAGATAWDAAAAALAAVALQFAIIPMVTALGDSIYRRLAIHFGRVPYSPDSALVAEGNQDRFKTVALLLVIGVIAAIITITIVYDL